MSGESEPQQADRHQLVAMIFMFRFRQASASRDRGERVAVSMVSAKTNTTRPTSLMKTKKRECVLVISNPLTAKRKLHTRSMDQHSMLVVAISAAL
jgi:hypothetical protein